MGEPLCTVYGCCTTKTNTENRLHLRVEGERRQKEEGGLRLDVGVGR